MINKLIFYESTSGQISLNENVQVWFGWEWTPAKYSFGANVKDESIEQQSNIQSCYTA